MLQEFTKEEISKELSYHKIPVPREQDVNIIFKKHYAELIEKPKSLAFRDYVNYGVYPARIFISEFRVTIPFITKFLSLKQVENEIKNQKGLERQSKDIPKEEKKTKDKVFVTTEGFIKEPPTPDIAFELIKIVRKNVADKNFIAPTPPVLKYLSIINFMIFIRFDPREYMMPDKRITLDLFPLVPRFVAVKEINAVIQRDPGRWGDLNIESISATDIVNLLIELIDKDPLTLPLRGIVKNYKNVFKRAKFYDIIQKMSIHSDKFLPIVKISHKYVRC